MHEDRPDGNLLKHIKVNKGDIEAGFDEADVVVDRTYRTPTTEHMFLEPECSIGCAGRLQPGRFRWPLRSRCRARRNGNA